MPRTRLLGLLVLGLLALSAWRRWRSPSSNPALDCPPEAVRWMDAGAGQGGFAACAGLDAGAALPASWARTLGQKLDLNHLSQADLAVLPGVGPKLAGALVRARETQHGFKSWEDVDAVRGVGPAKLQLLQEMMVLGR